MSKIKAHYRYDIGSDAFFLHVAAETWQGKRFRIKRIEVVEVDPKQRLAAEDMTIPSGSFEGIADSLVPITAENFVKAVMDAAWEAGVRPTGFADTTQQVQSMQSHINDLRGITNKLLDKS